MVSYSIVLFNYNYGHFLQDLLKSLRSNGVFNNKRFKVFVCDDGSLDNSREVFYEFLDRYFVTNAYFFKISDPAVRRIHPSGGQFNGLQKVIRNSEGSITDFFVLLDADDWVSEDYLSRLDLCVKSNPKAKVIFNEVFNVDVSQRTKVKHKLNRRLSDTGFIWPTVIPTSGVVISRQFLIDYEWQLTTEFKGLEDVWLDARISILAKNLSKNEFCYSNAAVFRRIHGNNDSLKRGYRKKLYRVFQSMRFMREFVDPRGLKGSLKIYIIKAGSIFIRVKL